MGLDNGTDGYITKPFGIMEFFSRIRAVLLAGWTGNATEPSAGVVTLNVERHTVLSDVGSNVDP